MLCPPLSGLAYLATKLIGSVFVLFLGLLEVKVKNKGLL